jgi:hypothetical protein
MTERELAGGTAGRAEVDEVVGGAVTSTKKERERERERERDDQWVASSRSYPFKYFFKKKKLKEMAKWHAGIVPRCAPGQMLATRRNAMWPIRDVY